MSIEKQETALRALRRDSIAPSYRALHSVKASRTVGRAQLQQTTVFESPEGVRTDVFSSGLNRLLAVVVATGPALLVYDVSADQVFRGHMDEKGLEPVFAVPLSGREFAGWLVGHFPLPGPEAIREAECYEKGDEKVLCWFRELGGRELSLFYGRDSNSYRLEELRLGRQEEKVLDIFATYEYQSGEFPTLIRAELPGQGLNFELELKQMKLDSDAKVVFRVPPHARIRPLSEATQLWAE